MRIEKPPAQPERRTDFGPRNRIAVIHVDGDLLDTESVTIPILNRKIAGSATLTKVIDRLRKDNGVKAVVVRLDTPGGSVTAADAIARELDRLRAEKPVVISMGRVCASGGYYIATAGQYLFADATTVTGSIGIFYPKMDLSGTVEKFGVGVDELGYGRHALLRSWWKPYDDDERDAAMRDIRFSYDIFVERVARARSITAEAVDEKLARGRVFSGVRAMEVGLVDGYGGLRESILRARAMAGLRADEGVVEHWPEPPGLLERIRALFGIELPSPLVVDAPGAGPWSQALAAGAIGIPSGMLLVLRHLPAPLWMISAPRAMALDPEPVVIE